MALTKEVNTLNNQITNITFDGQLVYIVSTCYKCKGTSKKYNVQNEI